MFLVEKNAVAKKKTNCIFGYILFLRNINIAVGRRGELMGILFDGIYLRRLYRVMTAQRSLMSALASSRNILTKLYLPLDIMPSPKCDYRAMIACTFRAIIFVHRGLPIVRNIKNNFRDEMTSFDSAQ